MQTQDEKPVIAVDGGGTRCRVAYGMGREVARSETGPANASTDFDGAVLQITGALAALADRVCRPLEELAALPAFVGLAGVIGPEIAERLREALPFRNARIMDDRPAALRGALGDRDGVMAHCGTGSFLAAQFGRSMRFAGGWGPVLGDEASAMWIGRRALSVTLESADGRRHGTAMSARLLANHDGTAGIVRFAGTARPPEMGLLAPLVTQYAQEGDALARSVMQAGADQIARALPAMGWRPGVAVCLTGGIGPHFAEYLPPEIMRAIVAPQATPLEGALALARELAGEAPDAGS